VREVHAEDGVARLEQGEVDGRVGLRTGVRLHVGEARVEQGLEPVDGELLDDVDVLTPAVIAASRVALGVLVRRHGALRLHDRDGREVLRRDHLQRRLLAVALGVQRGGDLGVQLGQRRVQELHAGHPFTARSPAVRFAA
jgi:hypothetical protein